MQTIIEDQHVTPRKRNTSSGLRGKAELIRKEIKPISQGTASQWHFLKHSLNPDYAPVVQASFVKKVGTFEQKLNTLSEQLVQSNQAPFFLGLLYFFLILWSGFLMQPVFLDSLTRTWLPMEEISQLEPQTMDIRSYASYQGDQSLSFFDFQEIDPNRFTAMKITEYRVKPGDTISDIALEHGLNMDTILSFNNIPDVRLMQVGQLLRIPNRDGLRYTVRSGDSLESIARANGTTVNALLDANNLSTDVLNVGTSLFIPNARMSQLDLAFAIGDVFTYPTVGRLTSGFGFRPDPFTGQRRFHNGLDFANAIGTPIRASMAGRVVHIESQIGNYGKFIILQHARGYQTLYAHLDSFAVSVGQYVSQGQLIGRMGNTGRSTGPHLHFSIIENGNFVDPRRFLR